MSTILETVKTEFDFSVDKFPLSGPDGLKTPFYGLFRSDNGESVGRACAKGYVPHQTDDVLALVESAGEAFEGLGGVECHFRHGHHVYVGPSKDMRRQIFGSDDNVFPRFMIKGGYDGRGFSASLGYFRDACSNLAMLDQVSGMTISIRHTSSLREKMDDLIQTFKSLRSKWVTLGDLIAELQNREVQMVDFVNKCFDPPKEDSQNSMTRYRRRTEAIFNRLSRERLLTGRPRIDDTYTVSAWEAFNAIQGYVQHDKTRKGSPSSFARVIAANSDKAVQTAQSEVLKLVSA